MTVLRKKSVCICGLLALSAITATCDAEPKSEQSNARPMGLDIVALVQENASDDRSAAWTSEWLDAAMTLVEENLGERVEFVERDLVRLDPDRLFLLRDSDRPVRVYFLNEGAGYRNTLGFSTTLAGAPQEGSRQLIFPDVSDGTFGGPLLLAPGDWVELGDFPAATKFEFFIIRNAINGGTEVFTNRDADNPDGLQHVVAWLIGDRYVLLGFEDILGGGDLDYNDVVIVADLGPDLGQQALLLPK